MSSNSINVLNSKGSFSRIEEFTKQEIYRKKLEFKIYAIATTIFSFFTILNFLDFHLPVISSLITIMNTNIGGYLGVIYITYSLTKCIMYWKYKNGF